MDITLLAVWLTGLLGGVHCAGMCGGIVTALSLHAQEPLVPWTNNPRAIKPRVINPRVINTESLGLHQPVQPTFLPKPVHKMFRSVLSSDVLVYNSGRLVSYTVLGALVGALGSLGWLLQTALPVQQITFVVTNLLLILMGLYVFGIKHVGTLAEQAGYRVWRRISPIAVKQLGAPGRFGKFSAGALWGLVPCGMVYGVLVAAAVSGSMMRGAALMLCFGLGTLPNLLLLGVFGRKISPVTRHKRVRQLAGVFIALFGLLGLARVGMAHTGKALAMAPGVTWDPHCSFPFVHDLCLTVL